MKINSFANTNVFAMRKGQTEQALGTTTTDTDITQTDSAHAQYYPTKNFLTKSLYKVPVNPLLLRGNISEDFADFTVSGGFYDTGVLVNGAISADTTKTIIVDTVDATTRFKVGDFVYDDSQALVGTIKSLTATVITLEENNIVALANNEELKVIYQTINSYEIHKADNDVLTHATAGINQAHQVKATFTLNSNTTANSGDTTGVFAGMSVTGTNIPDGTTVTSVTNTTTFVLSASATGSGSTELTFTKQTYNAVNRIYPNNNTGITSVNEYLSNLETTRGNAIKTYDVDRDSGQRFITDGGTLDGAVTSTATTITLQGGTNPTAGQVLIVDNEHMLVTAFNSITLVANVVRGFEGTDIPDSSYADETPVFIKDNIDHLWVLVFADDPNTHHFAKITNLLENEVLGDGIQFEPAIKGDIPKDTKYAIFSSLDSNLPKIDSDNQTLVACAYGLQGTQDNTRHHANTHVSRPFFYFLNNKDRLEHSTRYVLRTTYSTGISNHYAYSVFVTAPEYGTDVIDYGPFTMEATVVDMLYKADDPTAVDTLIYTSDFLSLTNGSPDTVFLDGGGSNDVSFDNSITDLDGSTTNWGLQGILKDSRFRLTGAQTGIYIVEGNNSTATTLTMSADDFSGASTSTNLALFFTGHAVDLDHNKMYCVFSPSHYGSTSGGFFKMKDAFRMAHRPKDDDGYYYGHAIGQTRYMHYTKSPLTNCIMPNIINIDLFESVTTSGGYVDITLIDIQKILAKKFKEGDKISIHRTIKDEEFDVSRDFPIGTFDYNGGATIDIINLENNQDLRFVLESSIPKTNTDTTSRLDPLFESFTVNVDDVLYHIVPDKISNVSSDSQEFAVRLWRKETDTEYNTTTLVAGSVPNFNTDGFRRKYSFLADNLLTNLDIDTDISNYDLDYDGASAQPTNRNVTNFKNLFETAGASLKFGETALEKVNFSRINDINLVFKGSNISGHRIKVEYGDKNNNFVKLKTHLKDERFLELYNKTDYLPYADGLSNVSLYGYPINSGDDPEGTGVRFRYDLARSPSSSASSHVRGVTSYIDYFRGNLDIERKVFTGTIESVEQLIEDGAFKLKIRGRDSSSKLLGPIVNKNFKFTEDIVYSTIGPIERMALYGQVSHTDSNGVYEVGATQIVLVKDSNALIDAAVGDLLFTSLGTYIGRIFNVPSSNTYDLEEGIPTRLKENEAVMISSQFSGLLEDVIPSFLVDTNATTSQIAKQNIRGNIVSFAKAMSANPYSTIRVNSLSGTGNKGIIFNGGNALTNSAKNAPVLEGNSLIGSSSSPHPLAKGYNIHAPNGVDFDLPFYCHLADEVTKSNNIDYVNLHTVNSLTDYDIVSVSSKEEGTVIEVAPICPAVLGRVDDNPLDGRDKTLVHIGHFPDATTFLGSDSIPSGHNGIFSYTTWIEELKEGDFIFDSEGNLFGRIIDISASSTGGIANDATCFTLDRPLFKAVNSGEGIYKYFSSASPPTYHSAADITFDGDTTSISDFGGTAFKTHVISSDETAGRAFLEKLEAGMRIKIEGSSNEHNNGVFSIAHVFTDSNDKEVILYMRKAKSGSIAGGPDDESKGATIRITVLTDYFTQGLYLLNTQGLSQGGVLTLVNNNLSSPNAVDNICKPIKWNGGIYHYFTNNTVNGVSHNATGHAIYSDYIYRYGNTKWRYFGLQKGLALSYINRRKRDGQIKGAYTSEKGRINGYATAYRIEDAKYGTDKVIKYPYGYHNNDFAFNSEYFNEASNSNVNLFDSTNKIREHPYFLEYLSPESRDFRPVTGSNFADFSKHGTTIATPEHSDYNTLLYPRFMPRIHDNHRGGDWQEDTEGPVDSIDTSLIYQKFTAAGGASNAHDYDIEWDGADDDAAFIDPAASDSANFTTRLANRWVKLGGWPDKNSNRTFKLGSLSSSKYTMEVAQMPFTQIGVETLDTKTGVGGSADTTTGFEHITVLYEPFIGPKFDGITRAKDHWELPDPKTLRLSIFSPSDMYPDSMARKHHIGYSGTVDSTAIARKFTDYNIFLKGKSATKSSSVLHEYYEGSLPDEQEVDDQYENLPISEASILPSEMKRFGLMRLIDCTYDWHFNLIDPERLPSDMSKLNTPNFEYTRYQPLKALNLLITAYDGNDTLTVSAAPSGLLEIGDQIFTDKGYYLGKVFAMNDSGSSSTIDIVGTVARHPILKSDGTGNKYYGYVYVCGDGAVSLANQDRHDSFFTFRTKGRGGKNTFTEVGDNDLNMLQGMINGMHHTSGVYKQTPYGSINSAVFADGEGTDAGGFTDTTCDTNHTSGLSDGSSTSVRHITHDVNANIVVGLIVSGTGIPAGATVVAINSTTCFTLSVDTTATNSNTTLTFTSNKITESKFMTHFNENFTALSTTFSSHFVLPPSFRAYFSAHTTSSNSTESGRTVNAMQVKSYLVNRADNTIQNPIATEYSHASNVLEWVQTGDNPYKNCDVVALGRYNIEQSITNIPLGGKFKISKQVDAEGFPFAKPAVFIVGSCDYNDSTTIDTHSGAVGGTITEGQGVMGDGIPEGAYVVTVTDSDTFEISVSTTGGAKSNVDLFLTNGPLSDIPYGNSKGGITDSDLANANSGEYTFITAGTHDSYPYAKLRSDTKTETFFEDPDGTSYVADGVYGAFVPHLQLGDYNGDLTDGSLAVTKIGVNSINSINGSNSKEGWLRIINGTNNGFLNFVDLTGMYLVGNLGTAIDTQPTLVDHLPFKNGGSVHVNNDTLPNAKGIIDASGGAITSMADTMVDPKHILFVKEHRREITGNAVAHELLIDNLPIDNTGNLSFFNDYRVMRPAETCIWPESPNELNLYCLSAQTTKEPQSPSMYGFIPPVNRLNNKGEFTGGELSSIHNIDLRTSGEQGENEAIMSMYVAIDMDGRHSQQQTLTGTISNMDIGNTTLTGSSTKFTDELKEGDVILLDHQRCYVKSIISDTSLVIAGKFGNDADLSSGNITLLNNTFTVLRDYIHLFNPTGNRNTFKSGSSFNMLLTDGVSKQKMSIGVEADYYDDRALCRLTLSDSASQPMYGIVSFGEIFSLKSPLVTKVNEPTTLKIGSTIVIGEEVEDVINNLLSEEDIIYEIRDNKEYPYFISPNYQGVDIFSAATFAARYKEKELRIDETGISLTKERTTLDSQPIDLSYSSPNVNITGVTRNKSTFDLFNEIIVYGSGVKSIKRNRKSIDKFGKKTLEEVNMELISQDDVDSRAKSLLSVHSDGEDRFTIKMSNKGIDFIKAGDLVTLDFPQEGIVKGQYKIYEIKRDTQNLVELEVGTYRKDLANRFAELSIQNKSNSASIRGSQFGATTAPLDFFDSIKLKELRLVIKKISLADSDAFTLGFQTLTTRKLDFGDTMGPLETITTIITDEDFT